MLVVMDTKRFARTFSGDLLRWTDRLIVQIRSLFLRTSGSSGVFAGFLA